MHGVLFDNALFDCIGEHAAEQTNGSCRGPEAAFYDGLSTLLGRLLNC